MNSVLITGGCGFIGANIALSLSQSGFKVTCFDNLSRRGSEHLLKIILKNRCVFRHGDVRNMEDLIRLPEKYDILIDCSAEPSVLVGAEGKESDFMVKNNLCGSLNCFEYARHNQTAIVFFSTSRVYPYNQINNCHFTEKETRYVCAEKRKEISKNGIHTDFPVQGAKSLYGATKIAAENILQEYSILYNIPAVINRCGVISGPWQLGKQDQGIFAYWMAAHYYKKKLRYIGHGGKGKQVRDVLHIDDLTALIKLQIRQIAKLRGEIFNVGGGNFSSLSLLETTNLCREISGNTVDIKSEKKKQTNGPDLVHF